MKKTILSFWFVALFAFTATTNAQQSVALPAAAPVSVVKTYQLDSKLMARQILYNVVFPPTYQTDKNARFPVLYLLHGYGGSHNTWTKNGKLTEYSARHRIIIVNPNNSGGWHIDSENNPTEKWESYFILELIPEIDKNFRTDVRREARAIGGISMGGYGALKFGVKHPDKFVFAASISGAINAVSWSKEGEGDLTYPFKDKNSQIKQANDLFKLFGELPSEKIANLPFIYLDCGTEDEHNFLPDNQKLAEILFIRKIPHEFRQLPGKHDNEFFIQQGREVLQLSERIFAKQRAVTNNNKAIF